MVQSDSRISLINVAEALVLLFSTRVRRLTALVSRAGPWTHSPVAFCEPRFAIEWVEYAVESSPSGFLKRLVPRAGWRHIRPVSAASPGPDASQERRQLQRWFATRPKGLSSGLQDRSLLRSLSFTVASLNDNGTTLFRRHCLRRTGWRLRRSWRQAPDGACL